MKTRSRSSSAVWCVYFNSTCYRYSSNGTSLINCLKNLAQCSEFGRMVTSGIQVYCGAADGYSLVCPLNAHRNSKKEEMIMSNMRRSSIVMLRLRPPSLLRLCSK